MSFLNTVKMKKTHGYIIEVLTFDYRVNPPAINAYCYNNKFYTTLKSGIEALKTISEKNKNQEFRLVEMFESYTGKCKEGIHWFTYNYENNQPNHRVCRFCHVREVL